MLLIIRLLCFYKPTDSALCAAKLFHLCPFFTLDEKNEFIAPNFSGCHSLLKLNVMGITEKSKTRISCNISSCMRTKTSSMKRKRLLIYCSVTVLCLPADLEAAQHHPGEGKNLLEKDKRNLVCINPNLLLYGSYLYF